MGGPAAPMGMPAGSGIPVALMLTPLPLTVLSDDVCLHDGSGNVRREVDVAKSIAPGTVVGRHMVHHHATRHRRRHGTMRRIARHTPSRKNRIAALANTKTGAVPRPKSATTQGRSPNPPASAGRMAATPRGHGQLNAARPDTIPPTSRVRGYPCAPRTQATTSVNRLAIRRLAWTPRAAGAGPFPSSCPGPTPMRRATSRRDPG